MKALRKAPIAMLVMIGVIVISSILGCRRSLLELRGVAEAYFDVDAETAGGSIQRELETISAVTINFRTIASRYLDVTDPRITELNLARQSLSEAETVGDKYRASKRLRDAVDAVNGTLAGYRMNTTDKGFRDSLYDDIKAAYARIGESGYNDAADEFNLALTSFPAYYLVGWMNIGTLEPFGEPSTDRGEPEFEETTTTYPADGTAA